MGLATGQVHSLRQVFSDQGLARHEQHLTSSAFRFWGCLMRLSLSLSSLTLLFPRSPLTSFRPCPARCALEAFARLEALEAWLAGKAAAGQVKCLVEMQPEAVSLRKPN